MRHVVRNTLLGLAVVAALDVAAATAGELVIVAAVEVCDHLVRPDRTGGRLDIRISRVRAAVRDGVPYGAGE